MGQTLQNLSTKPIKKEAIFNNRFVVELAECFHCHYRNLRILLSVDDWISIARGFSDSLKRWEALGSPNPDEMKHIELCRKPVAKFPKGDDSIKINLNRNLYLANEGRIFSEGAEFEEPTYCHLKLRDLRLEMSLSEFKQLCEAVKEAEASLCQV